MALGVRSYGNSLLMQNIFDPQALPDTIPAVKLWADKVLNPRSRCVENDCGTTIGRVVNIPEVDVEGLIELESDSTITRSMVLTWLDNGITLIRLRDTSTCVSVGGHCAKCGRGFSARKGLRNDIIVGEYYDLAGNPRAYQNYAARTFSGSLLGFSELASSPLPTVPRNWRQITSHSEMDRICAQLATLNVPSDEMEYILNVEDLLERALIIIGVYGVYANLQQ